MAEPASPMVEPTGDRSTIFGTIFFGAKFDVLPLVETYQFDEQPRDLFGDNVRARIHPRAMIADAEIAADALLPARAVRRRTAMVTLPTNGPDRTAPGAPPCLRVRVRPATVRTRTAPIGMLIAVECMPPSVTRVRIGGPAHSPGRIHQPCWK
ncbi:MAG TPA: hypothetical protein VFX16_05255 [Pseudonocardiaceae bacterium]|nr:hypothetical protein [Pseudonocardiaceae bacterium]